VEEVQAQLGADEALVLFLDTPEWQPTPEESFIWIVTRTDMRWVRSDLGRAALAREVQALRCGLDGEAWTTPSGAARCGGLLGITVQPDLSQPLPFDLGRAHFLYKALFGQVEDLIKDKRLLTVPSGPLTQLPFQVLVMAPSAGPPPGWPVATPPHRASCRVLPESPAPHRPPERSDQTADRLRQSAA